jgi:hypothetical protein
MPRIIQQRAVKGSQKWLQELINRNADIFDNLLLPRLQLWHNDTIRWLSPLEEDDYAEYQDETFLERLSVRLESRSLSSFWPSGGPVWDGLGKSSRGDIILLEAKSHISELASSCRACSPSLSLIEDSLADTAAFCGAAFTADWLKGCYQYANRLAHLYLLRHLNGIPAWLVFVYFVNDFEMAGPQSTTEWQSAIRRTNDHLGISPDRLCPYVIEAFLDVARVEILAR